MNKFDDVLVIGGCGFVGGNLVSRLVSEGCAVTSLDNYFTGTPDSHVDGVKYIEGRASEINEINFARSFDIVFYLGEYSRVEQSFQDIDTVFEFNFGPAYEVLKFCKDSGAKLVYSGSSTKFGDGGDNAFQSPYAWTKKINTELIQVYAQWFTLDYAITYFYNVYGPGEISDGKYSTLIAKFAKMVLRGDETLPVVSPGTQLRNFTHVDDIIDALLLVGERGYGDGYGIGAEESFSILEVAEMFGKRAELLPARPGNRLRANLNTDKTKSLGWSPKHKLQAYIRTLLSSN